MRPDTRLMDTEPTLAVPMVVEEGVEEKTLLSVGSVSTEVLRAARGPVLLCPPTRRTADE